MVVCRASEKSFTRGYEDRHRCHAKFLTYYLSVTLILRVQKWSLVI